MDTSETYIKMCQKAEEIQKLDPCKLHVFEAGNFYAHDDEVGVEEYDSPFENATWLPRQDQLQGMVPEYNYVPDFSFGLHVLCDDGAMENRQAREHIDTKSFEQCTLAFVMKEKYGKVWNGEEWECSLS